MAILRVRDFNSESSAAFCRRTKFQWSQLRLYIATSEAALRIGEVMNFELVSLSGSSPFVLRIPSSLEYADRN